MRCRSHMFFVLDIFDIFTLISRNHPCGSCSTGCAAREFDQKNNFARRVNIPKERLPAYLFRSLAVVLFFADVFLQPFFEEKMFSRNAVGVFAARGRAETRRMRGLFRLRSPRFFTDTVQSDNYFSIGKE